MKKKITTTILLMCTALICFAAFADINGKWSGVLNMGGNEFPLTYIFKADGDKLTGSVISPQGEIPMYEGKITGGTDFTFKVDVNGSAVVNTGKYYGDSVIVTVDLNGEKIRSKLLRDK